jgi:hypothetical protein
MKKVLLLTLLPVSVFAQSNVELDKKVLCNKPSAILSALASNGYKEVPVWSGEEGETRLLLLANEKTGTWTIVQMTSKAACIIGSGDKHKMIVANKV